MTGDFEQRRRAAQLTVDRAEKAIARDPSNSTVLASGSSALAALGEKQKAGKQILHALELPSGRGIKKGPLRGAALP